MYTYAIGTSSDQRDKADYTESYRIKDLNSLTPGSLNDTYFLETSYEDKNKFDQFKIEFENGKFKSLYFQTLSSDWTELNKR
jgi:hypothetical protein